MKLYVHPLILHLFETVFGVAAGLAILLLALLHHDAHYTLPHDVIVEYLSYLIA